MDRPETLPAPRLAIQADHRAGEAGPSAAGRPETKSVPLQVGIARVRNRFSARKAI
jgi:hypothetical protein